MKASSYWYLANFWIKTALFKKKAPIIGSIIITDKCCLIFNCYSIYYIEMYFYQKSRS